MVTITLYERQQKRHRCIEQSFRLCGRGRGWGGLGEWHWNFYNIIYCRKPVWGTLPVAKVMRKEARHMQRWDRASGVPLEILEHLPPKPESAYFTALCSHLHLWLYVGLSPTTSLWKRVNLQLQLIKFLGVTRVFQPTNSFRSSLLLLLLSHFSRVWLVATPWTAAYQAPPSLGFSRQEHWNGLP